MNFNKMLASKGARSKGDVHDNTVAKDLQNEEQ